MRGSRLVGLLALLLALMALAAKAPRIATASETFVTQQLTLNSTEDYLPQVSGNRIVWQANPSGAGANMEIFTWTPEGGTVQVTVNPAEDYDPQVSGDRVVWWRTVGAGDGTDAEIFTWTPLDGVVQITANSARDTAPRVSGDRVVWPGEGGTDGGADREVFTWTPADGVVQVTQDDVEQGAPFVSGDRLVWDGDGGSDGGSDQEVFTWTPVSGQVQLTANDLPDDSPQVDDDRVVWRGPGHLYALQATWTWTAEGGSVRLTDANDVGHGVSGDRIVWRPYDTRDPNAIGDYSNVFTWTPATGVVEIGTASWTNSNPRASASRIVWSGFGDMSLNAGHFSSWDEEIWMWTPASLLTQVTQNENVDAGLEVSGDRIVWYGDGGSDGETDYEVFTAVADRTPPDLSVPGDVVAEATAPSGAVVDFSVSAYDAIDGSVFAFASPASGSLFPLGTTTVTVAASDAAGNSSVKTFTVIVRDTTPPDLTVPANAVADATGPTGALVDFDVSAYDAVDGPVSVSASPASGSVFPVGTTMVTATAQDSSGSAAVETFSVSVQYGMTLIKPNSDGSSNYRLGSTVSVQFKLSHQASTPITNAKATLIVYQGGSAKLGPIPFLYQGGKADLYKSSFSTRKWRPGTYTLGFDLGDGASAHFFTFTLS